MKLTYEDKVQIYELRKQGFSFQQLSDMYGINKASLKYMIRLIDRYGLEIVKKGRNNYYSPALKQEMIDKVLIDGWSQNRVSLEYALPTHSTLTNWLAQYKKKMFYGYEKTFKSIQELEGAIIDYIDYYNNKRIKVKLKGLSPVQYRTKSFA